LPVACCLLPLGNSALLNCGCLSSALKKLFIPVAFGLKHFFKSGAFIGPLTVPHLFTNALNVSGAFTGVCLLPSDVLKKHEEFISCLKWAVLWLIRKIIPYTWRQFKGKNTKERRREKNGGKKTAYLGGLSLSRIS
jgi:hypothetical protein